MSHFQATDPPVDWEMPDARLRGAYQTMRRGGLGHQQVVQRLADWVVQAMGDRVDEERYRGGPS